MLEGRKVREKEVRRMGKLRSIYIPKPISLQKERWLESRKQYNNNNRESKTKMH